MNKTYHGKTLKEIRLVCVLNDTYCTVKHHTSRYPIVKKNKINENTPNSTKPVKKPKNKQHKCNQTPVMNLGI